MEFLTYVYLFFIAVSLYMSSLFLILFFKNRGTLDEERKATKFPTLSVLIPAWNEGGTIADTIQAVLDSDYPQDKIEQVKHCILSHRGSKVTQRLTKEALCVADADSMAHFDSISSLFYLAFFSHKMSIDKANNWLMQKLERSWNKLSPKAKEIIKDKYKASKLLLSGTHTPGA